MENITGDIEIKKNLTIAIVEWAVDSGRGVYKHCYKGHMYKIEGDVGGRGET